ncbi:MAG: TIR domain-containing protein [Cyanobacteria bacterium P01_F01_bin.116]
MSRHGLFLNVAAYYSDILPSLKVASAQLLVQTLGISGHFQTLTQLPSDDEGLSVKSIGQSLRSLLINSAEGQDGLIYISGYGITVEDSLGEHQGFLLPPEGEITRDGKTIVEQRNGISLDSLNGLIRKSNLSRLVVLWDCSHHNLGLTPEVIEASLTAFDEKPGYCLIANVASSAQIESGAFSQVLSKLLTPEHADGMGNIGCDRLLANLKSECQGTYLIPIKLGESDLSVVTYGGTAASTTAPPSQQPVVNNVFNISGSNLTNVSSSGNINYTESASQVRNVNASGGSININLGTPANSDATATPANLSESALPDSEPFFAAPVASDNPLSAHESVKAIQPIEIFFSYSHRDEVLRDEMAKHLSILKRQGVIAAWYDRDIEVGSEWAADIDTHLNSAQVILLLISPDFLASDYCFDLEMKRAMERHEAREAYVVPIILRPVDWSGAPFGKLQALPKNAKPVTSWANLDEAFENVAKGIRRLVERLSRS